MIPKKYEGFFSFLVHSSCLFLILLLCWVFFSNNRVKILPKLTYIQHTSTGHVYGDHKFYSDDYRDRGYHCGPSSSYRDANRNREDFENSRNFRKSNDHRSSYEEKSQNYTPPSMRRAASAHTSPWALKRDIFNQ